MSIENQNNNLTQFYRIVDDDSLHSLERLTYILKSKIIGRYLKANNFMGIIIPVLYSVCKGIISP
jgi:hypothetical protein